MNKLRQYDRCCIEIMERFITWLDDVIGISQETLEWVLLAIIVLTGFATSYICKILYNLFFVGLAGFLFCRRITDRTQRLGEVFNPLTMLLRIVFQLTILLGSMVLILDFIRRIVFLSATLDFANSLAIVLFLYSICITKISTPKMHTSKDTKVYSEG